MIGTLSRLEHKVGHIRRIDKFVVIDSFGVISGVNPAIDRTRNKQGWVLFTLSPQSKSEYSDGRIAYLPNRLYHALEAVLKDWVSLKITCNG